MSDELKPCPFCGAAVTRDQTEGMPDLVNHPDNGCVFVKPWAIKAEKWNTRAGIKDLTKQLAERQWISVDERLPAEGELVLVTNHAFLNPSMNRYFCTGFISENGKWYDPEDIEIYTPDYWMPIPALPDSEGDKS